MKVGILTFHRAHNYGAVLQCHALQQVLESMGHEVRVIDYRQPYIESLYAIFSWKYVCPMLVHLHLKSICHYMATSGTRLLRTVRYHRFRKRYLHTTPKCTRTVLPPFDCYVIGSDQLWSLHCTNGRDEVYWGQFIRPSRSKVVGYAISSNYESLHRIGVEAVRQGLENFSALSFREKAIGRLIYDMTGRWGENVLDPTLLISSAYWDSFGNAGRKQKASVVVYLMRSRNSRETNRNILKKAHRLAQSLNCGVTDLSYNVASPQTFVVCFREARYVITNSFHGTALALIFEKPLYAIRAHDSLDERYVNLLSLAGAGKMLADADFSPVAIPADYTAIRQNLAEMRRKSIEFLRYNIR